MTVSYTCRLRPWRLMAATLAFSTSVARAGTIYDEEIDGDLSGDRFAPSVLDFGLDENVICGSVGPAAEDDIFTFTLHADMCLSSVILLDYSSNTNTTFLGVQCGDVYPSGFNHWGYVSFGRDDIGSDLLLIMAESRGQFDVPLGPGNFTWWVDEYSQCEAYALCYYVVPEPACMLMLLLGLAFRRMSGRSRSEAFVRRLPITTRNPLQTGS